MGLHLTSAIREYGIEILFFIIIFLIGIPLICLIIIILKWTYYNYFGFSMKKLIKEVKGKHCIIVGGTKGLGKETAKLLASAGSDVTIIARGELALEDTKLELKQMIEQIKEYNNDIYSYSADASDIASLQNSIEQSIIDSRKPIHWIINAAGSAEPGFIRDQTPNEKDSYDPFMQMMKVNYMTAINTIRSSVSASIKQFNRNKNHNINKKEDDIIEANSNNNIKHRNKSPIKKASIVKEDIENIEDIIGIPKELILSKEFPKRIILVGSIMSVISFIGYSSYSSSKYAIRGLIEAVRSELGPFKCGIHLYLPGNMDTSGFEQENLKKPLITKQIEGNSTLVSPESAAKSLIVGILKNDFIFSNDLIGELLRIITQGASPRWKQHLSYTNKYLFFTFLIELVNIIIESNSSIIIIFIFQTWAFICNWEVFSYYNSLL